MANRQAQTVGAVGQKRERALELPRDWEDEYHRLKSSYEALKEDYNQKENHNKL